MTIRVLVAGDVTASAAEALADQLAGSFGVAPAMEHVISPLRSGCDSEGAQEGMQGGVAQLHQGHEGDVVGQLKIAAAKEGSSEGVEDERTAAMTRIGEGERKVVVRLHPDGGATADSAVEVYLECGDATTDTEVMVELIYQIVDKAFFAQLRTVEQLGYIVQCGSGGNHEAAALVLRVQGVKAPEEMATRIDAFLDSFREKVQEMTEETLGQFKKSIRARKLEPDKSIESRGSRLMGEICAKACHGSFFRQDLELEALSRIGIADVQAFYDAHLWPGSAQRRVLISSVVGGAALSALAPDCPQLVSLRATVPPPTPAERENAEGEDEDQGVAPAIAATSAPTPVAAAASTESAGAEVWPTFGASRAGTEGKRRGGKQGNRPRFMRVRGAGGAGCDDPNCGGMC